MITAKVLSELFLILAVIELFNVKEEETHLGREEWRGQVQRAL